MVTGSCPAETIFLTVDVLNAHIRPVDSSDLGLAVITEVMWAGES